MSAFHVVVRPRPHTAPSRALAPLYGLFDVVVDGVNITAKIGEGVALSLLADLAGAVAQLAQARRDRVCLQLYVTEEVWELGLEACGSDVLVTVYRTGPAAEVAVFERRVSLAALRDGVLSALAEARLEKSGPRPIVRALQQAQEVLETAWPPVERKKRRTDQVELATEERAELSFRLAGRFRRARRSPNRAAGPAHARDGELQDFRW